MRIEPRSDPMTTASPAYGRQYPGEGTRETKPPLGSASSVHPTGAAMKEQSDTPRTDAATGQMVRVPMKFINKIARERDEARAKVAEIEGVLRASGALNQKLLDEVDRLRALTICGCGDHFAANFEGTCPNCIAAGKEAKP